MGRGQPCALSHFSPACRTFFLLFVVLLGLEYVLPKLKCPRFHPQTYMLMMSRDAVSLWEVTGYKGDPEGGLQGDVTALGEA